LNKLCCSEYLQPIISATAFVNNNLSLIQNGHLVAGDPNHNSNQPGRLPLGKPSDYGIYSSTLPVAVKILLLLTTIRQV
jgi:hypothetical protein